MRVRVYDIERKCYFKSEVYAVINAGYYERMLVLVPSKDNSSLKFYDYQDKAAKGLTVLINTIIPERPDSWIYKREHTADKILKPFQNQLSENVRFFEYAGFQWLWDDIETLSCLLNGEAIPLKDSIFEGNLYSDIQQPDWRFIETQTDANTFVEEVCGFHDSVITGFHYISGAYVDGDKNMKPVADKRSVLMQVQSQNCCNFEMEFHGVTALNLRPAGDNYCWDIFDAALIVQDESVFFSDSFMEHIDIKYEGTWITAYGLKWRYTK